MQQFAGQLLPGAAIANRVGHRSRYFQGMSIVLLLLASIATVSPAIGRYVAALTRWGTSTSVPAVIQALQILVAVLATALPLTFVVHDLRTRHRLHPPTPWGRIGHGRRTGGDRGAAIVAQ